MIGKKIKASTKGFTLVELIVVITILAILGTIAFISFGSQSSAARDSKRKTDLSSLASKINVSIANGATYLSLVGTRSNTGSFNFGGTGVTVGTDYDAGSLNFNILGVNSGDFKDPLGQDYKYGTTTKDGGVFQLAATMENDASGNNSKNALIVGNFNQRTNSGYAVTASNSKLVLSGSGIGMFKTNDYVGNGTATGIITSVSSDLTTLTISGVTSGTTIALAKTESNGLVSSGGIVGNDTQSVVNTSASYLPY